MRLIHDSITLLLSCAAVCLAALFSSCDKEEHDGEQGLAVSLSWLDDDDLGTPVGDIKLWIYRSADGVLVGEHEYNDPRQLARSIYPLPEGNYTVVAATNLVEPFAVDKSAANSLIAYENLLFRIGEPSSSPKHAHYGVAAVTVAGSGITSTQVQLKRILSELTIRIEGIPENAILSGYVNNSSTGIFPVLKDLEGNYGNATAAPLPTEIQSTKSSDAVLLTTTIHLMPTVAGADWSRLTLHLVMADGKGYDYTLEAPLMKPAGKYIIEMKYQDMKPFMRLSAISINGWTEGWVINGEVLNPED